MQTKKPIVRKIRPKPSEGTVLTFQNKLKHYRNQTLYAPCGRKISEALLADLLTYKLRRHFTQQLVSKWCNQNNQMPNLKDFQAVMELFTFHDGFQKWEEARDLAMAYGRVANLDSVFEKSDFERWRNIRHTILNHLPNHIRDDLKHVVHIESLVAEIEQKLLNDVHAVSFEGEGGLGKTSTAVQVAINLGMRGIFEGIYFVSVRQGFLDKEGNYRAFIKQIYQLDDALRELATQIGISISNEMSTSELQALLVDHYRTHSVLIILDNLETNEDINQFAEFIKELARLDTPSHLLITSRQRLDNLSSHIHNTQLRELPREHAFDMLRKLGCQLNQDEVGRLYDQIGGNPLALRLFSVLIKTTPIDELIAKLEQTKSQWDTNDDAFKRHTNLFDYLYDRILEMVGEDARELCWDLGMNFVMERGVKLDRIRKALVDVDACSIENNLRKLIDVYLVNYDQENKVYSMHRLIIHYIRKHFVESRKSTVHANTS